MMRIVIQYSYPCLKTTVESMKYSDNFLFHRKCISSWHSYYGELTVQKVTSQNEKTSLLGKTKQDYASILRWMSFANSEVLPNVGGWFAPLLSQAPYNKKNVDDHSKAALAAVDVLEQHLLVNTFLVGERITLADLFSAGILSRGFQFLFGKEFRAEHPNLTRWYETIYNQPIYSAVVDKLQFIEEPIKYQPPKKEAGPKKEKEAAPKANPKPKAKDIDEEEEEEDKPAPKPKHPLEALPKPTLILDDWKRKYSNEETREVALPWFWENFKADEYSIWKMDYKYNDELTMVFMTSNLIGTSHPSSLTLVHLLGFSSFHRLLKLQNLLGGFFTRLEASRKYIFGCGSVYGKANDSVVQGAFVIRGQDAELAFDVAPDYESYSFTKLDPSKKEDREFVDDQWTWDRPTTVEGKTYEWQDGKVFK